MRISIIIACFVLPLYSFSQIGIKGGLNFANVTKASSINNNSRAGFHIGILLAPPTKTIVSSRSELLFSRQGYNYKTSSNTGSVNLDYLSFQQGMSINISKYFSLYGGVQTAYLLNAKVDSNSNNAANNPYGNLLNLYNRFEYGLGIAAEVHPFKGLLFSAKYNVSLSKLYKSAQMGQLSSFSSEDLKNNVVQLSVGWIFGSKTDNKNSITQ